MAQAARTTKAVKSRMDTLGMFDDIKKAGASDDLSRAITVAVFNAFEQADLASKADVKAEIAEAKLELKKDIDLVKKDIDLVKKDIHDLDVKITTVKGDLERQIIEVKEGLKTINIIGVLILGAIIVQFLSTFFKLT